MKIITTILLILTLSFAYGQKQATPKDNPIDKKIVELSDSLNVLKIQFQELKEKQNWKNEVLNDRLQQASDTISNQNSLLDGFGVLYTIITIIIALIGVVLPVLTYQFGIKPSQDALKEFENNADKKMEEFLAKSRNKQIEQAIENLKSQNQELKTNAVTYLSLTQHQGFSDQQLFKLFMLLKSDDIDQVTKGTLAYTISNRKSDYATEYFKEAVKNPANVNVKYAATRYFANIGVENHLDVFRSLVANALDKNTEFNTILIHIANTNKNAVKILINDKLFVDNLDNEALKMQKLTVQNFKASWQLTDKELEESYLNEKIKNTGS